MDRTVATGTGYVGQYRPPVAKVYESLATTPDELVLFFHHVSVHDTNSTPAKPSSNTFTIHTTKAPQKQPNLSINGNRCRVTSITQRFNDVLARLEFQAGHAIVWRDAICNYFLKKSGIADAQGRAGHFPNRIEAESMQLRGYTSIAVTPWENVSQGRAIECKQAQGCGAGYKFTGKAGELQHHDSLLRSKKRRREISRSSQRFANREVDCRRPTTCHKNRR